MWILAAIAICILVFAARVRSRRRKLRETTARLESLIQACRADYVAAIGDLPDDRDSGRGDVEQKCATEQVPEKRLLQPELPMAAACMSESYVEQHAGLFAAYWSGEQK